MTNSIDGSPLTKESAAGVAVPRFPSILSWQFLTLLAMIASVLVAIFRIINPSLTNMALTLVLFPASFAALALTLYTRPFARYAEVKLLGVFLLWVVIVLAINSYRIVNAFKGKWFYCMCVTTFLCFPFAFGFSKEDAAKALSAIAAALLIGVTLLSSLGLLHVTFFVPMPDWLTQGACLGIGSDGRLHMLCHPNTFGPICGGAILLAGYLFTRVKRVLPRVLIVLTSLVCFAAQALTDSRTAIFATALGIALEAFLAGALLLKKRRSALRVAFAIVIAIAAYGAFTQGSVLVRTVYPVSAQALEEYKDATAASETDGAAVSAQAQAEYKDVTTVSETDGAAVASRDLSDLD